MTIREPTKEDISLARTLLFDGIEIVPSLKKKPKSIGELSLDSSMHRTEVSYRLNRLESIGVVQSRYEIVKQPTESSPRGKSKRVYEINQQKLDRAMQAVENVISFYNELIQGYKEATI